MQHAEYFHEKVRQCRRLADWTSDERAKRGLEALALDFEAQAAVADAEESAAQAQAKTVSFLGNGEGGSLIGPERPNVPKK